VLEDLVVCLASELVVVVLDLDMGWLCCKKCGYGMLREFSYR
jgi:hypothetical protein